jgi:acyl-CoA hydrolase
MNYKEFYRSKLTSAAEAVKVVQSGDWVDYGWCCGHPKDLDVALAARYAELTDVKARGGVALWQPEIGKVPAAAEHFTWNSWHMGGGERKLIDSGVAFYAPIRYSELPRYYRENVERVDVAIFQVAPMDKFGFFNFGPNSSHLAAVCERAKVIIVEVNENMPYCLGGIENGVHISDVDMIVEGGQLPHRPATRRARHRGG